MERQYILDAIDAALCAGKDILSIYNDPTSDFQIEKKADNSPLTIADKKAHAAIAGYLQKKPYPLLSEEGKHLPYTERCAWTTLWIVDPLWMVPKSLSNGMASLPLISLWFVIPFR